MWRWKYFQPHEVLSPVGMRLYQRGIFMMQEFALDAFDALRERLGGPLIANNNWHNYRGYRTPEENNKVGGAAFSRHVQGIALDVDGGGQLTSEEIFNAAIGASKELGINGIIHYKHRQFVHLDCRAILDGKPHIEEK